MRPKRLFSVKNMSTEEVPPFGLMALDLDPSGDPCQEEKNGQVVWHIKKPDAEAASVYRPSMIFVNRSIIIPPEHYGVGSQEWPVRALLDSATIKDGTSIGLEAGEWHLSESGNTFALMSNDEVDDEANDLYDLGWVVPNFDDGGVPFELLAAYTQFSTTPVLAVVRTWDKTANSGLGGFTSDCVDGFQIKVWDAYEVGHTAGDGGMGRCNIKNFVNGYWIGHIRDLCCPGDEQGVC